MLIDFWHEYYEFLIAIFVILLLMLLAYVIFFRPNNTHNKKKKAKLNNNLNDQEDIVLNDDFSESELDNEFFEEKTQEHFVLGENSNILESIPKDDIHLQHQEGPIKIDPDHEATDEIFNEFKSIEELMDEQELKESENENFETKLNDAINLDDHEKVLSEIVNSVIQKDELQEEVTAKYHVLYRKEDKKWYVKREGAKEGEKFLITQKEAIAYATIQALLFNTTIVVHDEDGKIGKYNF